jgi:hypothetical protein
MILKSSKIDEMEFSDHSKTQNIAQGMKVWVEKKERTPGACQAFAYTSAPLAANSFDFCSMPVFNASSSDIRCSAAYLRTSSVIFMEQKCGPHIEHLPSPRLRRDRELREEKSWGRA